MHNGNPSTREIEAGGTKLQGYPQLHSKFKVNVGYKKEKKSTCVCPLVHPQRDTCRHRTRQLQSLYQ